MRIWKEHVQAWDEPGSLASKNGGTFTSDKMCHLPFYLDTVELGYRVADYINSPGEEQMLEDMMWSSSWLTKLVGV
jgi:hypothetical protein